MSNPWQFASGCYDATTGLYKFGTRYYSPTLGCWTQKDPVGGSVGQVGSGNPYVYADNAPVMTTDPSGRGSWGDCIWLGADVALVLLLGPATIVLGAAGGFAATGGNLLGAFLGGLVGAWAVYQAIRSFVVPEWQACYF